MKSQVRFTTQEQQAENLIPQDMVDLVHAVQTLPSEIQAKLDPYLAKVLENHSRRKRILSLVQDALSQLRLDMKYLMFDLEATRRERDDFRRRVEEI